MELRHLIDELSRLPSDAVARPAFGRPMSHRADYSELAFEPIDQSTAGDMLRHAKSAIGATFEGYKGGDYTMSEWTPCHIAAYGRCGESITPLALAAMFRIPELEAKVAALGAELSAIKAECKAPAAFRQPLGLNVQWEIKE